jgi:hypothetical protein
MFSRFCFIFLMWLAASRAGAQVESFQLETGESVSGEFISADKDGLQLKTADGSYQRTPWIKFSEESLKDLVKNPKARPFVTPLIEATLDEQMKKAAVEYKPGPRLERPVAGSKIGALFASPLGVFMFLVLYLANLYAAYEIAIFRNHLAIVTCGVSAVAPFIGPVAFLCLPGRPFVTDETAKAGAEAVAETGEAVAADAEQPSAAGQSQAEPGHAATLAIPQPVTYLRGQYMFNRRFFETKLAGFLRVVPSAAEKDMLIVMKSSRGEYVGKRISRITPNELFLHTFKGDVTEDVLIPFNEVLEVVVKHVDT